VILIGGWSEGKPAVFEDSLTGAQAKGIVLSQVQIL
jgi:hypothetical protein